MQEKKKRKRVRFILCGVVSGEDPISDFRLIAPNNIASKYNGSSGIRVELPDDLTLEKWASDPYSTTRDERTLDEIGYDCVVWSERQKKWIVRNDLKGINPCDFHKNLAPEDLH